MKILTVDKAGGTTATSASGGMVRLELWTAERERSEDPIIAQMTVGQALGLMYALAGAAKVALSEVVK